MCDGMGAGREPRVEGHRGPPQARGVRHGAAASGELPPRTVRGRAGRVPAMRLGRYRGTCRIRFDLLQGTVALQKLPRTVRLFQMPLIFATLRCRSERRPRRVVATIAVFPFFEAPRRRLPPPATTAKAGAQG